LFERPGPSLRPELPIAAAPRAAAVKAGRRPPPKAARSGLDGREHAAPITSARKPVIALDQQQSIFDFAQDKDEFELPLTVYLVLSEVEGPTVHMQVLQERLLPAA